jgi:organic hydroperoxide reductase OsmC/OhrA
MAVVEELQFPVSVRWRGGRVTSVLRPDHQLLEVATPPEFAHGIPGFWSPEDLLVSSVASCFALTLAAIAERAEAPLIDATIDARGRLGRRESIRFGFTEIEIDATLETTPGGEAAARRSAADAERYCLVTQALRVPVRLRVDVHTV